MITVIRRGCQNAIVILSEAKNLEEKGWIPACAGMTVGRKGER
jgi:hypothetical protein